jgi:predicted RNA-binding protein with TRAM domain
MPTARSKPTWIASLLVGAALVQLPVVHAAPTDPVCITDSTLAQRIDSQACGKFKSRIGRFEEIAGVEVAVVLDWMVHKPTSKPKALVVLLMGGAGQADIEKGPKGSVAAGVTGNFLVRSAQLFAEAGYLAVSVDAPEDLFSNYLYSASNATFDAYRVSAKASQDLATVIAAANGGKNLNVFLAGTSRGANFAVAKHPLAVGVSLSSPISAPGGGSPIYVDAAAAAAVGIPSHVLSNLHDDLGVGCLVAQRSAAAALSFSGDTILLGTQNRFDDLFSTLITGGFCDALSPHGFYGIETSAVAAMTDWMDDVRTALPANTRPRAKKATRTVKFGDILQVDLAKLAKDKDGDGLTFSLPHAISSRGAPISLAASVVTYTPVQAGIVDGFVYVVADGKGGRSPNVVTVKVKP